METEEGMDEREKSTVSLSGLHEGASAFAEPGLPAPTELTSRLILPQLLFESTLQELRDRSADRRESAATWCGNIEGSAWTASAVRFHHRLCDDRGRPLSINL